MRAGPSFCCLLLGASCSLAPAGDGKLYAVGGNQAGSAVATVARFVLPTAGRPQGAWEGPAGIAPLPAPRTELGLVGLPNGRLVSAGGHDDPSGSAAFPKSAYAFRLAILTNTSSTLWSNALFLTIGITNNSSYWSGNTLVTHTNFFWELEPVEVVSNPVPKIQSSSISSIETQVFLDEGIDE